MKKDSKLFKILINLDIVIASIALVILVGCTFAGVIARYVVGKPFGWIEEIQAAFIVWVVFAAGGAAYRTGNHSAIEILYEIFLNLPFTWIYMIVPVSCMLQIFNYFLVNVFGYEDEVEKLVEEDEDE